MDSIVFDRGQTKSSLTQLSAKPTPGGLGACPQEIISLPSGLNTTYPRPAIATYYWVKITCVHGRSASLFAACIKKNLISLLPPAQPLCGAPQINKPVVGWLKLYFIKMFPYPKPRRSRPRGFGGLPPKDNSTGSSSRAQSRKV
jgi:hypothetical protein